jgi:hypothetical protein
MTRSHKATGIEYCSQKIKGSSRRSETATLVCTESRWVAEPGEAVLRINKRHRFASGNSLTPVASRVDSSLSLLVLGAQSDRVEVPPSEIGYIPYRQVSPQPIQNAARDIHAEFPQILKAFALN